MSVSMQRYIASLNALRAIASIWVVFYHFRYFSTFPWFAIPGVSRGYLGVDLFFVLSGLVISHVYLEGSQRNFGYANYLRFLGFRLARIWPVHAVFMFLMLLATLASGAVLTNQQVVDWISLTLLVRQWLLPEGYVWNTPAWSVSAEFFAYAFIFPLVVLAARRLSWHPSALVLITTGLSLFAILEIVGGTFNIVAGSGPLIRVTAGFLLGAGTYCLLRSIEPAKNWDVALWAGVLSIPLALNFQSDLLFLLAIMALIVGGYMSTGPIGKAMTSRPLFLMGEWSFGLYLAHIPVLIATSNIADHFGMARGFAFGIVSLALAISISAFLYYIIEQPARKYSRRRIDLVLGIKTTELARQKT